MSPSVPSGNFVLLTRGAGGGFERHGVPAHPVYLVADRRRRQKLSRRRPRREAVILEAVRQQRRPVLLMLCGSDGVVRRNGRPALPVEVLHVGDEIRWRGIEFFVSRDRGQRVGVAEGETSARCPLCRAGVEAGQRIYRCMCGTLLHCVDDPSVPEEDRLECARMVPACPHCSAAIEFEEGLEWQPES